MIDYGSSPDGNVSAFFKETKIMKNKAYNGGGIYIAQKKTVTFDYDCEVSYNKADSYGGGVFLEYVSGRGIASVKLGDVDNKPKSADNKMQVNNNEAQKGSAVYCLENSQLYIKNTLIKDNIDGTEKTGAIHLMGGAYFYNSSTDEYRTVIEGNKKIINDNQKAFDYGIYCEDGEDISGLDLNGGQSNFNYLNMANDNYLIFPKNTRNGSSLIVTYFYLPTTQRVTSNFTLACYYPPDSYSLKKKHFSPGDIMSSSYNMTGNGWSTIDMSNF